MQLQVREVYCHQLLIRIHTLMKNLACAIKAILYDETAQDATMIYFLRYQCLNTS